MSATLLPELLPTGQSQRSVGRQLMPAEVHLPVGRLESFKLGQDSLAACVAVGNGADQRRVPIAILFVLRQTVHTHVCEEDS